MKFFAFLGVLVACVKATEILDITKNIIPAFLNGRIANGHEAIPHSAPYIVSISKTPEHIHDCGGTIIAKDWILTDAHCITTPTNMSVIAGLHERSNFDSKTQLRLVDWGKIHENYAGGPTPNDIALLHLSVPLKYNQHVQPATLPAVEEIHSGATHLYGWGQFEALNFSSANVLQTVKTKIIEFNACKKTWFENAPIDETNMCSDALKMDISACSGDSGGPLVIEREGALSEVIGIVSWGFYLCGMSNLSSVYVRVSAFIGWIFNIQNAYYVLF